MGRRSTHTPEELRELILRSAQDIIERGGLAGLSAREVARRIGYSPGTLYNTFENLDDLVLHVEGRLLEELDRELAALPREESPEALLRRLAQAYLAYTHRRPKLWNLLFEHHLPPNTPVPAWYQQRIEGLLTRIEEALAPLLADSGPATLKRSARVLWAGVHGITSLSTTDKLSNITAEAAQLLVDDLVTTYIVGLKQRSAEAPLVGSPAREAGVASELRNAPSSS
jgi:AcrR family transcriptional regulator